MYVYSLCIYVCIAVYVYVYLYMYVGVHICVCVYIVEYIRVRGYVCVNHALVMCYSDPDPFRHSELSNRRPRT